MVDHQHSTLPIQCVVHQTQHSPLASSPPLHIIGRLVAFLSKYHSSSHFLSKMGDERRNYCGIILGCCTHSEISMPNIKSKSQCEIMGDRHKQNGKPRLVAVFELDLNCLSLDRDFKQRWEIPPLACYRWHSNRPRQ